MTDAQGRPSRGRTIAILIIAVVIVAGVIIAILFATRGGQAPTATDQPTSGTQTETTAPSDTDTEPNGDDVEPTPLATDVLPESMGGQEAIDALGDKIDKVAQNNGMTADELKELLLRSKTAQITPKGFIVYLDTFED